MAQLIKINGEWKSIKAVYKKVNGHWVHQDVYAFDNTTYFPSSAPIDFDVFLIVAEDSYSAHQFYVIATLNNTQVSPTWSITSGNQYATINSNGKVTILQGAENGLITVSATYLNYTDSKSISVTYANQLTIEGAESMTGTSGNVVCLLNSTVVNPTWTITSGNQYATINSSGQITIISSGEITVSASYQNLTANKNITLTYEANTTSQTQVDPDTGAVTTSETTTTTDPNTGAVTTENTSTTTNADGTSTESTSTLVENTDGSSTSQSEIINYDENGDTTGSTTNNTTNNADGSSQSQTTNYDANGDPTDRTNVGTDTSGNINTQNIEYDEQGNQNVVGYDIDTTASEGDGKEITGNGVNTEFIPFDDNNTGFICHIRFKSVMSEQPRPPLVEDIDDSGTNWLYNVMSAKAPVPAANGKYPGFDIRWGIAKSNASSGDLRFRYAPVNEGNQQKVLTPAADDMYDLTVTYDPQKTVMPKKLTISSALGNLPDNNATIAVDKEFAALNMDFTLGYAIDSQGQPYRHAAVTIYEFSITKLQ